MKSLINIFIFFLVFASFTNGQNYLIKAYYDADKLEYEWNIFISNPTEETALKVYNLLPEKGHVRKEDNDLILEENIFQNLNILEKQILEENKNSIKLAFRLFTISDGAFTDELNIILGQLIKLNPELFLIELNEYNHLVILGGLLCNYGPEYYDSKTNCKMETEERINKLSTIEKDELIKIRDKCIEVLAECLENFN